MNTTECDRNHAPRLSAGMVVAAIEPGREGELAMKKILCLALLGMVSLALVAPASAGMGHGGGFHGGFHHGFGFHRSCCFGPFVGGVFVGSVLAAPYYAYPYAPYPVYPEAVYTPEPAYQPQAGAYVAPSVQREACYPNGCYHLQGDGVTVAYSWIWVPAVPAPPTAPPSR
jgi:hypothetical protein